MDHEDAVRLWEEIYCLRLHVEALEAQFLPYHRNRVSACAHETVLDRATALSDGPEREGAIRAYDRAALKTQAGQQAMKSDR